MPSPARGSAHIRMALVFAAQHPDLHDDVRRARALGLSALEAVAAHAHLRRDLLMPAVDAALTEKSAAESGRTLHANIVVVGGGPLGAALSARLAARGLDVLVLDDGDGGGAFASLGAGFRLNTPSARVLRTTRAVSVVRSAAVTASKAAGASSGMSLRDDDDLHPGLAVPLSVLTGARFPSGAALGDAARITLAMSRARVRLRASVAKVHDAHHAHHALNAVARHGGVQLTLADHTEVHAARALFCTGYGAPRDISRGNALAATDVLGQARSDLPLAWADVASLAVIGAGPSALAVWALALGFGPHEELERPGRLARVAARSAYTWVTGERGPASAHDARDRMRSAAPHTMPFVIQQAVAPVLDELVQLEAAGRLTVVRGRATWTLRGRAVDVAVGRARLTVERAVCATGFVSALPQLWGAPDLRTLVANDRAQMLGVTAGAPSALAIGAALVVGAALEELVPAGFDEPPLAGAFLRALPIVDALPRPRVAVRPAVVRAALVPGRSTRAVRVSVPRDAQGEARASSSWTSPLDVRLALAGFDLRPLGARDLTFTLRARGGVEVRVTGLDAASARAVAHALSARLLRAVQRWGSLKIRVRVSRGRVQ